MLYCSFCGKRIHEESVFCSNCGQRVSRVVEVDEKAPGVPEIKQKEARSENVTQVTEETERVPEAKPIEPFKERRNSRTQEQARSIHTKKVIPAILSKEKDITKYVVEIDGKRIEVVADFGKKPKVELFVEGEPPEIINEQESEVSFEFEGLSSSHTIDIWYSLAGASAFKFRYKETGVAIKIDGVPIKNSLADPLVGIRGGLQGLLLFTIPLAIKFISSIIQFVKESTGIYVALIYLFGVVTMIIFALLLKSRPKTALYGGLTLGLLETGEHIFGAVVTIKDMMSNYSPGTSFSSVFFGLLIWTSFRIWALHSIWKASRALKRL